MRFSRRWPMSGFRNLLLLLLPLAAAHIQFSIINFHNYRILFRLFVWRKLLFDRVTYISYERWTKPELMDKRNEGKKN